MKVHLKIQRYNPEKDSKPYFKDYAVECEPTDRVLDALLAIKGTLDGSLTLRKSCGHGVCGSDGMRINGRNMLACKVLIKNVSQPIVVEPLKGFKIVKDLVVDMKQFFEKYVAVKPYLINQETSPEKERLQSQKQQERFEDTTKCILCACCTTACPSFWSDPNYAGPASIVQAHRFIFDSRDQGGEERLNLLNQKEGVWRCRTIFNCVEACPRDINITKAIGEIKKDLLFKKI
ncbi:MAG: succinate dehydrogenase iron-sulfur subunit [Elusimicrobia bacterium RIFCSPLOWO2_02_FULL_39_32]|nr:MAG: succinate dehydrogenase iron-sulfur subunit [Elusimicrobia bacterium GWA2_38_7]OGR80605.1 MAG: succinate dehydrogenase iron-sulfur subunit [Elusimicrobia bacterium RIFCSPHIGHO2_02_FULL_39_36]OGR91287.1 MAG: succinate dehydrogenase iron-sulfur subunit [Elusimicrobia bacterium RIFCSPLOWO2_02_FULL_39_32]OGS00661.1 MAG: succinate dehydrogenase iron-sulfur subunit [Elusimicrobia bacterium RIFCSPLOWO2_12_FULL_39_28]